MNTDTKVLAIMPTRGRPRLSCLNAAMRAAKLAGAEFQNVEGRWFPKVRNDCVRVFLRTDCTHLWIIDEDVEVPPDALPILLSLDADIASGVYPWWTGHFAVLNCYADKSNGSVGPYWYWPEGEFETEYCGMGCCLIRRQVFDVVGWPWFRMIEDREGGLRGEDVDLCWRAREFGMTIRGHGQVRCGHKKEIDLAQLVPNKNGALFASRYEHTKAFVQRLHNGNGRLASTRPGRASEALGCIAGANGETDSGVAPGVAGCTNYTA